MRALKGAHTEDGGTDMEHEVIVSSELEEDTAPWEALLGEVIRTALEA